MADVRINALATTATSAASDDYLALDGSANGTRKILATNVAQNVTDVTFGTSGPSAKSSIAARAARQGLVLDGTQVPIATSISSVGTGDYSWAAYVTNKAIPTVASFVAGINDSATDFGGNRCALRTLADGTMDLLVAGVATSLGAADTKTNLWVVTRSGTTLTVYKNGVSVTTTTDSQTYGSSYFRMGGYATSNALWQGGVISAIYPYNRALSAAEVVSLYEAGVPSGGDYVSAGTALIPANFASGWVTNAGSPTLSTTATLPAGSSIRVSGFTSTSGRKYRFRVTVDSLTAGSVEYYNGSTWVQFATAAGTYTVDFTAPAANVFGFQATGGQAVLSSPTFTTLGLLLAPDAAQAGGGLTWYDTSGNAANITLPASGVTWNVPSSRVLGGNWTVDGGRLTLNNATESYVELKVGGTTKGYVDQLSSVLNILGMSGVDVDIYAGGNNPANRVAKFAASGIATTLYGNLTLNAALNPSIYVGPSTTDRLELQYTYSGSGYGADSYALLQTYGLAPKRMVLQRDGGNLLLGTTTDSGNGKLQLATHTTSAGGIGFGTDTSLFRSAAGNLQLSASVTSAAIAINNVGSGVAALAYDATGALVYSTGSLRFQTNGSNTALTLDSSQRCILAGALRLNNAYVAGAPTATGYVTLQDSAGNTYKVLVGT